MGKWDQYQVDTTPTTNKWAQFEISDSSQPVPSAQPVEAPPFLPFAGTSIGDIAQSGKSNLGNMVQAIMHPIQTVQGMGNMALGGIEKLLPGQQPQEPYADAVGAYAQHRYGSFEKLKETWKHDPVGVALDASMVLSGGGGAVAKVGDIAAIPKMAKFGRMAATAGELIDPLMATSRAARFAGTGPARFAEKSMKGLAGYEINSLIKPRDRQFSYAKNPGLTFAQEGLVAGSVEGIAQKATQRYQEIGEQIGQVLQTPVVASKQMNLSKALEPIHKAIVKARQNPRTNEMVIRRLENVRDDLLGIGINPDGTPGSVTKNLTQVSPIEAFNFKKTVGELTKWTEQLSDDSVVNAALKQTYGIARSMLEQAVPGIHQLNERFAGLLEASKAATHRAFSLQRNNPDLLTVPNVLAGGIGYVHGGFPQAAMGVLLAQGAHAAVQSPWIRTGLASFIAHSTPSEVTAFFNRIPGLQNEMMKAGLMTGTAYQRVETSSAQ